jgi:hypothetical protein
VEILPYRAGDLADLPPWERMRRDYKALRQQRNMNGFGTLTCAELAPNMAGLTGFTGLNTFTSEASLIQGTNQQPTLRGGFYDVRRSATIWGGGLCASTGTPTYTFYFRLSTTEGATTLSGTVIGQSAAISMQSGVSNKVWFFWLDLTCTTPGQGTNACTLYARGCIWSPGGFASPYSYALTPGGGDSATLSATIDGSLTQYLNISVACSASSSSNAITLYQPLNMVGWN